MTLPKDLLAELRTRNENYSLSRDFYSNDDIYQTELETIWYQSWIFAGHPCEVTDEQALDFPLGDYQLRIMRDNGKIVAAAEKDGQSRPIHCREVEGYLFVNLAETPDDFATFAEAVSPYMQVHHVNDLKIAAQSSIVEYGNWKLVLENNRECYHCLSNHPELIITYPEDPAITGTDAESKLPEMVSSHWEKCEAAGLPSTFKIADDGTYRVARMPLLEDFTSYTMDGHDAVKKHIGDFKDVNPGALVLFHYPSTWNHFLDDQVISFRILPIAPQATLVTTKWLVHKDAVEGMDYDKEVLTYVWNQTNAQDKHLVEENQKGINSPLYESGPYSSVYESGVIQFVKWYGDLMQRRLQRG
ncbi:MAG: Rieske (2Fe-2S) protein [Proteobacteria bacterium]|nr:MAG: Rieske (2Fe-2S) protein [Pseudomonadota bacterium]